MNPYPPPPPSFESPLPYPNAWQRTSTKAKLALAGAVALVVIVIIVAATGGHGHGPQAFLDAVAEAGFYNRGGDQAQLGVGYDACELLEAGNSVVTAAHQIYLDNDLSVDGSVEFVEIAKEYLC
jgi:hypothetical protein